MKSNPGKSSWVAFLLFYIVLLLIVTILDWANHLLTWRYWGTQAGLVTLGVGIFALAGLWIYQRRRLLWRYYWILTIIPGQKYFDGDFKAIFPAFGHQYFSIALVW